MAGLDEVLSAIPAGLKDPLIEEYTSIVKNYSERRWRPSELAGGRFCEVVYTILDGHASGTFPDSPQKPRNFVEACRRLENRTGVPRSFQILIPRLLPGLYEIRNNRNVGHIGGDVDPSYMDSTAVVSIASWILAEMIRVFHNLTPTAAQKVVDQLVEHRPPLVWVAGSNRRILNPQMRLKDQVLVLIASAPQPVSVEDLKSWTETKNNSHFLRILRDLHKSRMLEFDETEKKIELLPPGMAEASNLALCHG